MGSTPGNWWPNVKEIWQLVILLLLEARIGRDVVIALKTCMLLHCALLDV